MKLRYLFIILILLLVPFIVDAETNWDSSGGAGDPWSGKTVSGANDASGSIRGLRFSFVDENGNPLSVAPQSYDFLQTSYTANNFYTMVGNKKSKKQLITSSKNDRKYVQKSTSKYPTIETLYTNYTKFNDDDTKAGSVTVELMKTLKDTPVGNINTRGTFFSNANKWFIRLTDEDRKYGRAKYNALALFYAISKSYTSLNYKEFKALLDTNCGDKDIFIIMEPIVNVQFYVNGSWDGGIYGSPFEIYYYLQEVKKSPYDRYCNLYANGFLYYKDKIKEMKYFTTVDSCSPSDLLTKEGWAMNLDWISPDGKCDCSLDENGKFWNDGKQISSSDVPSKFAGVAEYALTSKNKGGAGCCKKLKDEYIKGNLPDNFRKQYAKLCSNKCEIDENGNFYDGNGLVSKAPSGFSTIGEYAFKTAGEGGVGCCSKFETIYKDYNAGKAPYAKKFVKDYQKECLTCQIDSSNNIYDSNGKVTKAYAKSLGFETIGQYAFSPKESKGLGCCDNKNIKKAYNSGTLKGQLKNDYDALCQKSCVFENDKFYYKNELITTSNLPTGFSSVPEFAFSSSERNGKDGANCCDDVDPKKLNTEYRDAYDKMCSSSCTIDSNGNLYDDYGIVTNYPRMFDSIEEYAFDKNGLNCCKTLEARRKDGSLPESYNNKYDEMCTNTDCCGEIINPDKLAYYDIHNCCYDDKISTMREYNMNALLCYDDNLKVNFYKKNCNADKYKQSNINDYCELLCSERVIIELPDAITATSGRYFELTKNSQGYTSPYINAYKRCRMLIKYDKWQEKYQPVVNKQIESYNEYQQSQAYYLTYRDNINDAIRTNESTTIHCSLSKTTEYGCYKSTCYDYDEKGYKIPDSAYTCYLSKSYYPTTRTSSCLVDYTLYNSDTKNVRDFTKVYKNSNLDKLEINNLTTGYTSNNYSETNHYAFPSIATNYFNYDTQSCRDEISRLESTPATVTCEGVTEYSYYSCWTEAAPSEIYKRDVESERNNYEYRANIAQINYTSATAEAETLEKQLDQCDHYFDKNSQYKNADGTSVTYTGSNANQMYNKFNAKQRFEYTQVYLNDSGKIQEDVQSVDFLTTPGCVIDQNVVTTPSFDTEDDELENPQYSLNYNASNHIYATRDFKNVTLRYVSGTRLSEIGTYGGFLDTTYNADKKFTSDARYHVECNWNEGDNKTYTLVPSGKVAPTVTLKQQYTSHSKQYKVYLTTLVGDYETKWYLTNIGEKSQFDKYLEAAGNTCSGKSPSSDGTMTCMLKIKGKIAEVGACNSTTPTISNPSGECNPPKNNDYLLFNFRIIDPTDPFPNGTVSKSGKEYAYNWTKVQSGKDVAKLIIDDGKKDKTYSPDNLSYSFKLTTTTMKHIRNYNKSKNNNGGYNDFNLYCKCPSTPQACTPKYNQTCENIACTQCKSELIDNLVNDKIIYNGAPYDLDKGVWRNSKTLGEVRKNNWK